jgi:hypothetical protein
MLRFAVVPATFSVAVVVVVAARHSAVRSFGEASPVTAVTAHRLFAGVSDPIGLVVGTRPEAWDRHVRVQAPLKIYQTANVHSEFGRRERTRVPAQNRRDKVKRGDEERTVLPIPPYVSTGRRRFE